ncbi:hypothetical protein AVEN_159082-1 [Araneus ventricosus]|uniref:Uncharacterized protein n=1 Tax=Araneus ventricosus TaxID=182803 RepID=A0A4Y2BBL4_ARAVE|nr:hypothetical protein AVEN_159082-1 [Araneus ventricosus]
MLSLRSLYPMIIPFSMSVKSRDLPITAIIDMRTRTLKPPLYAFQQTDFSVLPVIGHNCVYVNLRGGHNIVTRLCIMTRHDGWSQLFSKNSVMMLMLSVVF